MKKLLIPLIIALVLSATALVYVIIEQNSATVTGAAVSDSYSYTKAICNDTNFCQDYVVVCNGNDLVSSTPITGATIQHSLSWQDPRSQELIESFCPRI